MILEKKFLSIERVLVMKKDKMYGFRLMKPILGTLFKWYYNPTIIGKENIPKKGSCLIVGNHVHIMDQCLAILSTKRCLHYMAKKEYFDNKKVAWFFKAAGSFLLLSTEIQPVPLKNQATFLLSKYSLFAI